MNSGVVVSDIYISVWRDLADSIIHGSRTVVDGWEMLQDSEHTDDSVVSYYLSN